MEKDEIRDAVRHHYREIAVNTSEGCCSGKKPEQTTVKGSQCCSKETTYSINELSVIPEGSDLGLGCGSPVAIARLKQGETVLDLGSGGGIDCFLASLQVGEGGSVIGVDMTPEMISRARANASKSGFKNVEFRLGEIEHLPVADNSVDVVLSNCVVNLSPDKEQVFKDAYRVLRPGGRLAISDIIALTPIPENLRKDMLLHSSCVSGAVTAEELRDILFQAKFENIRIEIQPSDKEFVKEFTEKYNVAIASATIEATRP